MRTNDLDKRNIYFTNCANNIRKPDFSYIKTLSNVIVLTTYKSTYRHTGRRTETQTNRQKDREFREN